MNSQANDARADTNKEVPFQEQFRLFVGFDWASDHHDVVAVDAGGKIVLELTFDDTAEGWAQ